jgi:hypothetical protein
MQEFKFFQKNPYKDRCRLDIGSSFQFRGYYCTVTKMGFNHFEYLIQEPKIMAKRLIEKKIIYYRSLLGETKGFFKRLLIRLWIWDEQCKLRKYKKNK